MIKVRVPEVLKTSPHMPTKKDNLANILQEKNLQGCGPEYM